MKKHTKKTVRLISCLLAVIIGASSVPIYGILADEGTDTIVSDEVTDTETDKDENYIEGNFNIKKDGYLYVSDSAYGKNNIMKLTGKGTAECQWDGDNSSFFSAGINIENYIPDKDIIIEHSMDITHSKGHISYGVHSWIENMYPFYIEIQIIDGYDENWWESEYSKQKIGSVTVGGTEYDVYKFIQYINDIAGYKEFVHDFMFIRRENTYTAGGNTVSGKTNLTEHIRKCADIDDELKGWENYIITASSFIEAFNGKGSAKILRNDITITKNNGMSGDLNKDGKVNILDLILGMNMFIENEKISDEYDLNGDGKFDINDILLLRKYILGIAEI